MELNSLLTRIHEYDPVCIGSCRRDRDIQLIRLFDPSDESRNEFTLYLTDRDHLPSPKEPGRFTLLCCGLDMDLSAYSTSSYSVIHVNTEDYQKIFNRIQTLLHESEEVTASMHSMVNALLSENGLQYLVDTVSNLLGNPIYVVDLSYKYLAISSDIHPDNDIFREEESIGYISEKGMEYIKKADLDELIRSHDTASYVFNSHVRMGMMIDNIVMQEIEVGHVMMLESARPFRPMDADLFHRFSRFISIELQKDTTFTTHKGLMYSYFLSDLITHPESSATMANQRLTAAGYDPEDYFYVIVITSTSFRQSGARLALIIQQIRSILPRCMYVQHEGNLVFVTGTSKFESLDETLIWELETFLSANHLKAGISNFFTTMLPFREFYLQAVDSVNLGMELSPSDTIFYYSDYYIYQMMRRYIQSGSELRYLIHPGMMQLMSYDKENNTDFMHTLEAFLKYPGQSGKLAKILHIHKNTLLYRMQKIKAITHCDFTGGDDFMSFALSWRIARYLHMI